MLPQSKFVQLTARKRVVDAGLDVDRENLARGLRIALKRAIEKLLVLARGNLAAKDADDHLVAQILVIDRRVRLQKRVRSTGRYQGVVEFPVVAFPGLGVGALASNQLFFDG